MLDLLAFPLKKNNNNKKKALKTVSGTRLARLIEVASRHGGGDCGVEVVSSLVSQGRLFSEATKGGRQLYGIKQRRTSERSY